MSVPMFWAVTILLTLFVVATLARALLRDPGATADEQSDVAVYKAQLAEIDRDVARGTLAADEAGRTRTEVARRLLAADKNALSDHGVGPRSVNTSMALLGGALIATIAFGSYFIVGAPGRTDVPHALRLANAERLREARPGQEQMEQLATGALPPVNASGEYVEIVETLRAAVAERGGDLQGWELLALHEARLGNYGAARLAQERVIQLKGSDATAQDWAAWADRAVAAAGGEVSPEVETAMLALLEANEADPAGRYYVGLLYAQTDRADLAFRLWRPVAEGGDPQSIYTQLAQRQIGVAARAAGVRYQPPDMRGPSAAEIAAAENMTPEERQSMIEGMVASLSERLRVEGGPAEDWARLMRAYGVLGEVALASDMWAEAQVAFEGDGRALAMLRAAAIDAGVDGVE